MLQLERKKQVMEQSEQAKKKYLEYWKSKLISVYASGQKNQEETIAVS